MDHTTRNIIGGIIALTCLGGGAFLLLRKPAAGDSDAGAAPAPIVRRDRSSQQAKAIEARWSGLTDPTQSREARLEIARGIDAGLGEQDVDHLFSLMRHRPVRGDEGSWWEIVNEIMEQMRKEGVGAGQYTSRLSAIIADPSLDVVLRDYAIQHLGQWIAPAVPGGSPGEGDPALRSTGLAAMTSAVKDPSLARTVLPGTGLLTLVDVSGRLSPEERATVWSGLASFMTETINGHNDVSMPVRASAIQAASLGGRTEFLPAIRTLARLSTEASTRLCAVNALGSFADPADEPLLREIASTDNPFQYAARASLQRMRSAGSK